MEGVFVTEGGVRILKRTLGKALPVHTDDNTKIKPDRKEYDSLLSGHTTMTFTAASIVSEYYPRLRMYTYASGAAVGIQRVVSESHWVSNVILSGILGHYTGKAIVSSHLQLYPLTAQKDIYGIEIKIKF